MATLDQRPDSHWQQDSKPACDSGLHSLEKIPYAIYPKSLYDRAFCLKNAKYKIVKRESNKSSPNGTSGIIAMSELNFGSLSDQPESSFTDAWGNEYSSRRELLSAHHPKYHKKCPVIYARCLSKCKIKTLILMAILSCFIIMISCVYYAHPTKESFDGSVGPHGGKPGDYPNIFLPVKLHNLTNHSTYFGVDLNWDTDDPQYVNTLLNTSNTIFAVKLKLYERMGDKLDLSGLVNSTGIIHQVPNVLEWKANLIVGAGAIMGVDVIPFGNISLKLLKGFSDEVVRLNARNISILLRFAPDMNGNWWTYGQSPTTFKSWFRYLSYSIKNRTNLTAMVWSPAPAHGYPYPYGRTDLVSKNNSDFKYLDTNKDGVFDFKDNPYFPYYPGDDAVDWIGISSVFRGLIHPAAYLINSTSINSTHPSVIVNDTLNVLPPQDYNHTENPFGISFEEQLTGGLVNLYEVYAVRKNKPVVLWDVGAAFYVEYVGETEVLIKSSWLSQIINPFVLKKYALIKAVILNDLTHVDQLCNNQLVDYGITRNPEALAIIKNQLSLVHNASLHLMNDNSTLEAISDIGPLPDNSTTLRPLLF